MPLLHLGFSRVVLVDESLPTLPAIAQLLCVRAAQPALAHPHLLSLVVSYAHSAPPSDRVLNIPPARWPTVLRAVHAACHAVGASAFRIWTDQLLSARTPSGTLRWTAAALLPFAAYPVLYVSAGSPRAELTRAWIAVERLCARLGHGVIEYAKTPCGLVHIRWTPGLALDMVHVVRRVCGIVMCGFLRNKTVRFAHDGQALIEFAAVLSSSVCFGDIAHVFDCTDCARSLGFCADVRLLAVLSSCAVVWPDRSLAARRLPYPPVHVPALRLSVDGRTWHGFREWLPEACLWGAREDERPDVDRSFLDNVKCILVRSAVSSGRAIAVLQLAVRDAEEERRFLVGYLAVQLGLFGRSKYVGAVDWCQRFWPRDHLKMWNDFECVFNEPVQGHAAFLSLATVVAASSCVHFSDFVDASDVSTINLKRVRW